MYKAILENINGVEIWPVIGLVIFFVFFVGVLIWAFRLKKEEVDHMANIPLEDGDEHFKNGDLSNG
ncbi:MAG: CcoQ/FixQ family Cbb3-type cytochrome c oxidase assembly chaperone [Calditrichaeota bacterium]|nr:CcoQ/FixQ family Cbb3-type cytochrome c oxidase assembly chaperone [Calditrichota bacterium]MCB0266793.1 CcoQ/FixQ family Cbb3-type cytochrome c oxidase assembly chaperone [Calditrichota bacterium]MCB0287915.1 CcoQ/FixQ family Cbb3-type cytochrome c oxidase assembly chaperone [Calditrichota bacterium]MCB0301929.1 CcoQ/FixQ family Cbb3-type cytochrome c oxidase assembly chaperone [Calditrichota bacterium]MCB9066364.1 CcoQ/FixQ family Cbb3-type cytochrome c oxidase assembly chaperone [Calditri